MDTQPLSSAPEPERVVRAFHRRWLGHMHDAFAAAFYSIAYRILQLIHCERVLSDTSSGRVHFFTLHFISRLHTLRPCSKCPPHV